MATRSHIHTFYAMRAAATRLLYNMSKSAGDLNCGRDDVFQSHSRINESTYMQTDTALLFKVEGQSITNGYSIIHDKLLGNEWTPSDGRRTSSKLTATLH